ncbi:MAG TPA: hypothetical protein VMB50_08250 [Myxococcales bacterium]|nr:hypothetical protein [Myxococcales bacterium]
MTNEPSSHLTSLALDALSLPTAPAAPELQSHLDGCESCRAALDERLRDREVFLREVFPASEPALQERARGGSWLRWVGLVAVPAAALAAVLVFLPLHDPLDGYAAKGGARFQTYARRSGGVFEVHDADVLRPGDELRFVVDPGPARYLLVGSIDGADHASIYYPYDGQRSAELGPGRHELAGSIVLDDAPGPERLFALLSREPLAADAVRAALERVGAGGAGAIREARRLDVPSVAQLTLHFEKVVP